MVISGFSGAGKGTVIRELVNRYHYRLSVSATTRQPREGEEDGVHYFFKSREEFLDLIRRDGFIEYARYVDHYYGTPKDFVEKELSEGNTVLLEIEVQGALSVRKQYPDAILIFITAPSAGALKERLAKRGTESDDVARKRMIRASEEAESIEFYDYIVVNEDHKAAECAETIRGIITAENCRLTRRDDFVRKIRNDLAQSL